MRDFHHTRGSGELTDKGHEHPELLALQGPVPMISMMLKNAKPDGGVRTDSIRCWLHGFGGDSE